MKPFVFKDISVYPGDNRISLRALIDQGVRVHSVVTDPPYGLTVGDSAGGFMGKAWDASRIERDPEFWKLIYDILLPGGYVFAFSGSRTGHWQACAMEMAGFAMHPMHGWVQSQGFPKAVAADKAIDKMLGATREVVGFDASRLRPNRKYDSGAIGNIGGSGTESDRSDNGATITAPATPEATLWKGWAYGTQAQKPSLECVFLGQKPFENTAIFSGLINNAIKNMMEQPTCQKKVNATELLCNVNVVEVISTLNNHMLIDANIAQGLVRLLRVAVSSEPTGGEEDMFALMDMLLSELMTIMNSNTAKSWLTCLVVLWSLGNTFTTAITSEMITDLKTWNSLVGQNIQNYTMLPNEPIGDLSNARIAGTCLKSASVKLISRISTIATERVIETLVRLDNAPVGNKPRLEPIYLGQKPFSEKTGAANILKHGVGAVNIDGCRVPTTDNLNGGAYAEVGGRKESPSMHTGTGMNVPGKTTGKEFVQPTGRHPANLILDGSPEVVAMFPDGKSGDPGIRRKDHQTHSMSGTLGTTGTLEVGYGDSGSNARFFHQFPHTDEDYFYAQHLGLIGEDRGDALVYNAKATSADRAGSMHPTVKPVALMRYLVRHVTPPGGIVLDPFAGSGTTGEAARQEGMQCILMEAEPEYVDFLKTRFHLKYEPEQQPSNDEEVEEKDDSFIFLGGKPIF